MTRHCPLCQSTVEVLAEADTCPNCGNAPGASSIDGPAPPQGSLDLDLQQSLVGILPAGTLTADLSQQLAALGRFQRAFGFKYTQAIGSTLTAGLLYLLGLFFLVTLLLAWWRNFDDEPSFPLQQVLFWIGLIVSFFATGTYFLRNALGHQKSRAFLFDDGILHFDGDRFSVVRWADVESVQDAEAPFSFGGQRVFSKRGITITDRQGQSTTFTEVFYHIEELANVIRKEVALRQVPRLLERLRAGEALPFGRLTLLAEGLSLDGHFLRWDEVASVETGPIIYIEKKGRRWLTWGSISANEVPNLFAFVQLSQKLLKPQEETGSSAANNAN